MWRCLVASVITPPPRIAALMALAIHMEQMIRDAVQRGAYLNPTMGYELGSQSSLARSPVRAKISMTMR